MTTEQLKKLYATGEWILLTHVYNGGWMIDDTIYPINTQKLIHKKHSEVLRHVLSDGEVKDTNITPNWTYDNEQFIELYNPNNTYEIIKNKPSLNEEITFTKEGEVMTKTKANELLAEALSHDEPTKTKKLYELVNGIFDDIGSCGECKHYALKMCCNKNSIAYNADNAVYEDDGCLTDFERKQHD